MNDIIAYAYVVAVFCFGIPFGVLIERMRVRRATKKNCPDALKLMKEHKII